MRQLHVGVKLRDETLQFADSDGAALLAQHAMALTLFFMRAHAAADGWQVGLLMQNVHRLAHIAHRELVDEVGDVVFNGAGLLALRHLAMEAAFRLVDRFADGVHAVDLLEERFRGIVVVVTIVVAVFLR